MPEQLIMFPWRRDHTHTDHVRTFPPMMFVCAMDSDQNCWRDNRNTKRGTSQEGRRSKYEEERARPTIRGARLWKGDDGSRQENEMK